MIRSTSVLNFRSISSESQAASSTPSIGELKLKHSLFMESQKGTPADLSEAYSKIKKQLFENRSVEVAHYAIEQLKKILIEVESTHKDVFINSLKAKCRYLLACCLLYATAHSGEIDLDINKAALGLIESARMLGLPGLEKAQQISTDYYKRAMQLSEYYGVYLNRLNTPLPESPWGSRIETPLRKVVGVSLFNHQLDAAKIYLMEEMPKIIDEMLSNAIDFDPRMGKDRYLSLRLNSK
ncbi:hypothetical protein Lmor_0589 [Legionella moravica]|uniref:Dot/Icm secretion system substrate n=1 Tax=Legionella moravica TaxID=39962 RepID=A0ABR5RFF8_9GAMM|nr:hypothetical protein [Legionella moravica]KTD37397.1 hypothetical protein Lmor_0589 [Legionella moravica]